MCRLGDDKFCPGVNYLPRPQIWRAVSTLRVLVFHPIYWFYTPHHGSSLYLEDLHFELTWKWKVFDAQKKRENGSGSEEDDESGSLELILSLPDPRCIQLKARNAATKGQKLHWLGREGTSYDANPLEEICIINFGTISCTPSLCLRANLDGNLSNFSEIQRTIYIEEKSCY